MSIASLGSHKYGRAEDQSQSNSGGGLVVRHIPIMIEGEEHKSECCSLYSGEAGNPQSSDSS